MRRVIAVGVVLVLAVGSLRGLGEEPDKESALMKKKLEHAQKVLEGIAVADYKKIAGSAEELIEISKAAEWKSAVKSPRYELYSSEFRRVADSLAGKAREKNLDGAALAYVELTLTCVKCHKHVREVRMVRR